MDITELAEKVAREKHSGQIYDGVAFADGHLARVVTIMKRFVVPSLGSEYTTHLVCAAWLHDILEDTDYTYGELVKTFGLCIAQTVYAVTDREGPTRKERKFLTYPQIKHAGKLAVGVKVADRLTNVLASLGSSEKHLLTYRMEHSQFVGYLFNPEHGLDKAWSILDVCLS